MNRAGASAAKENVVEDGENFAVGKIYSVKVITGDEFNGIVLVYDSASKLVIFDISFDINIQEGTKPRPGNLKNIRMVNADFIIDLKYLGKVKDPLAGKKLSVNLDELREKEKHAISNIENIGVGVTAEAQSIFDAISKTLPVRWDNKDILVMGEVFIRSPYDLECVFGGPKPVNDRVKNVLRLERKKLQLDGTGRD